MSQAISLPTEEEIQLLDLILQLGIVPPRPSDENRPTFTTPDHRDCCYSPECPYSKGYRP